MERLSNGTFSDRLHIHQIYYDAASRSALDPGFIPLDNSTDTRPDWYEFWAIRKYLLTHELQDDHWYGFLSPKFGSKTGLHSKDIFNFLKTSDAAGANVGLALCHFNEIALFWNCFEQGEQIHPGLTGVTEQWLLENGFNADIRKIVNHTHNFTYCNYVFAKKDYWLDWLKLAESLLAIAEGSASTLKSKITSKTHHAGKKNAVSMKVFIQERFPAILLRDMKFKVISTEHPGNHIFQPPVTLAQNYHHAFLATMNHLKYWYDLSKDTQYSDQFFQLRKLFLQSPKQF